MIAARFAEQLSIDGNRLAAQTADRAFSYARLVSLAEILHGDLESSTARPGQTIGIAGGDLPARIAALLALESHGVTACLFPAGFNESEQDTWSARLKLDQILDLKSTLAMKPLEPANHVPRWLAEHSASPEVWLFTSGTTGPPQPVKHVWESLTATLARAAPFQSRRWLMAYDPSSFAGLQVWLQAILTGGSVHDVSSDSPERTARRIVEEQFEFASGTPTFWRMLLGLHSPRYWHAACLKQITLGGEPIAQGTLNSLREAFPQARLTQIYATSELGVCFRVTDGQAGFPADYLTDPPPGCRLRIAADSELEVNSARRAVSTNSPTLKEKKDSWLATGDLVEVQGERVVFLGRKSGVILVGGSKVLPEEVEAVIRSVPGVREVRVSGQPSSLLGAIVRAEVEPAADVEETSLKAAIAAACQERLPRRKRPGLIEFVPRLPRTESGKLSRQGQLDESPRQQRCES